ncbi:kinase-like domain-containing protein [Rhizophagus irregularis DAOM 181602=DAOM 197198]|nr:kinase-like domain-containing protein [Rhizophagus irregularis DAOM 181602=DAOM 197198]
MLNILVKEDLNLNENLNEFLKEWEYHTSVLASSDIINVYGFTKDPNTSKYMVVMDKKLNEILESENLNDCVIKDLRTFDENIIKLNEILESEDSQASVKTNEILVSENLSDCIIKNLGSSDIKTDEN